MVGSSVGDARVASALVDVLEVPLAITDRPANERHPIRLELEQGGCEVDLALRTRAEQLGLAVVVEDDCIWLLDRIPLDVRAVGVVVLAPIFHMRALSRVQTDERFGLGLAVADRGAEKADHLEVGGEPFGREHRLGRQRVQSAAREVQSCGRLRGENVRPDQHCDHHQRQHEAQRAGPRAPRPAVHRHRRDSSSLVVRKSAPTARLAKYTVSRRVTWPRLKGW